MLAMALEPHPNEWTARHHTVAVLARVLECRFRERLGHAVTAGALRHVRVLDIDQVGPDPRVRQVGLVALQAHEEATLLLIVRHRHESLRGFGQSTTCMGENRPSLVSSNFPLGAIQVTPSPGQTLSATMLQTAGGI